MARPRRSEINDDNRRDALIRAAARLFNRQGYQGTSVRDIAAATGMQSGSPFYHFASKQDLLYEATMQGLALSYAELEAIWSGSGTALERFRALVRTHLGQLLGTDPEVAAMIVSEWRWLEGEHRARVIAMRDRFEQLWQQALDALAAGTALSTLTTSPACSFSVRCTAYRSGTDPAVPSASHRSPTGSPTSCSRAPRRPALSCAGAVASHPPRAGRGER